MQSGGEPTLVLLWPHRPDVLSPRMVRVIEELTSNWRWLDERIEGLSGELEELARRDAGCERLMSVPGIGPIISSAMVAAIGTGDGFSKGRDRRLVGTRAQAGLDRRPHHPRQHIEARQSLSAGSVRAGGVGRTREGEAEQAAALHKALSSAGMPVRPRDAPRPLHAYFTFCGWQRPLLRPCNRR